MKLTANTRLRTPDPGGPLRPVHARPGAGGLRFAGSRSAAARPALRPAAAFTMIEIALCLAIIGFALISILLVLPTGMDTQRETREETIINQDATMLLEAIRNGERGLDDLTNNVYAITNYAADYDNQGKFLRSHIAGYTRTSARIDGTLEPGLAITNGLRIIGLLSTPEYTSGFPGGVPMTDTFGISYTSNHVYAFVRSFSGLAAEKPPQNNQIMQEDTFSYQVLCVNAPMAANTSLLQPMWAPLSYPLGSQVFQPWNYSWHYWRAIANTSATDIPGQSVRWALIPFFPLEMAGNLRELRLMYLWPQLPNGTVGRFRQTYRASIDGQLSQTSDPFNFAMTLYFYQPQTFANSP